MTTPRPASAATSPVVARILAGFGLDPAPDSSLPRYRRVEAGGSRRMRRAERGEVERALFWLRMGAGAVPAIREARR